MKKLASPISSVEYVYSDSSRKTGHASGIPQGQDEIYDRQDQQIGPI